MPLRLACIAVTFGLLLVSLIDAPYPREQRLQHIPTVASLALLAFADRRYRLSAPAFYGLLAFLALHIVGARWIYSFVPYDVWANRLVGVRPSEVFGWTRNHYDRFVHLAFGGLALPTAVEFFRRAGTRARPAVLAGVCLVTTASALYEIAEWQIAVWLSPDQAAAYNGQQGDFWDAQKDMALALLGSVAVALPLCRDESTTRRGEDHGPV